MRGFEFEGTRNVLRVLVLLSSIAIGCADATEYGASDGDVYVAVYRSIAQAQRTTPLVHPRMIRIENEEYGTMYGYRPEHYLDSGTSVQELVSSSELTFCDVLAGAGCTTDAKEWIAFSQISREADRFVVWATYVDRVGLFLYRANVTGPPEDQKVELTILDHVN